MKLYSSKL